MKQTIILATVLMLGAGLSAAQGRGINEPPKIPLGTEAKATIQRMRNAGWLADPGRCLKAYPNVCEADFVNKCGVVVRATFLDEKITSMKPVAFIDNPPTGRPQYPPCIDGTD